ncbi:MAG TPA: hypothetical protein PLQ35_02290 [bacterium]|mgnify:CR=1 FL=1|nr:hypothetical protein [bacterium]HQL61102.1 hypothetical protein [bacterium]
MMMPSLKTVLLAAAAVAAAVSVMGRESVGRLPLSESTCELLLITALVPFSWYLVNTLSEILERKASASRWSYSRLGYAGWALYCLTVVSVHYGAWVPVALAAVCSLPLLVLPMVARWIVEHPAKRFLKREKPVWRLDELSRASECGSRSYLIGLFTERYPKYCAYLYRRNLPYSVGGILMQNRERLATPRPTYLEVTLDCPFGTKIGTFLEGHEVLQAYLFREQEDGSRIVFLPAQGWDEWIEGMRKLEWFQRIGEVDDLPPRWPILGDLPYPLVANGLEYKRISLT